MASNNCTCKKRSVPLKNLGRLNYFGEFFVRGRRCEDSVLVYIFIKWKVIFFNVKHSESHIQSSFTPMV